MVLPDDLALNFAISLTPNCFTSSLQPQVTPLIGQDQKGTINTVSARNVQGTVEIRVTLDPAKPPKPDCYRGIVYDRDKNKELGVLKLIIY